MPLEYAKKGGTGISQIEFLSGRGGGEAKAAGVKVVG